MLISYYYFRTSQILEVRAHTATAVALALGVGFNQIRSFSQPETPVVEIQEENEVTQAMHLPAPADALEEGERINGFWTIFMLQKNLSVTLDPTAQVCSALEAVGLQIDTPWPLQIEDYKQVSQF